MSYREDIYNPRLKAGQELEEIAFRYWAEVGIYVKRYTTKEEQYAKGECSGGIEIKHDQLHNSTGNLYIEVLEKQDQNRREYVWSGIYRNDNSWLYCVGDKRRLWVFPKRTLVTLHHARKFREVENDTNTSVGFLMPKREAWLYEARELGPEAEQLKLVPPEGFIEEWKDRVTITERMPGDFD